MKNRILIISLLMGAFFSCQDDSANVKSSEIVEKNSLTARDIVDSSYNFYGVDQLVKKSVCFKFRKHDYGFVRSEGEILRTREMIDSNNLVVRDEWRGEKLQRFVDGEIVEIDSVKEKAYRNSINSVFYFAFLPKGLKDPAVNLELLDEVKIKNKNYYKVRVTFDEIGGGEDHNDIFIYWFDKDDFSMDYLAYEYFTEGGGIRFREAINVRSVEGITFQDYVNYKPKAKDLKLENTDHAFEKNNLKEVSRIELENVKLD